MRFEVGVVIHPASASASHNLSEAAGACAGNTRKACRTWLSEMRDAMNALDLAYRPGDVKSDPVCDRTDHIIGSRVTLAKPWESRRRQTSGARRVPRGLLCLYA